jgi:hypothetical protein
MPRFVILEHRTPPGYPRGLHWDLMLEYETQEQGGALRTWALAEPPAPDRPIDAESLADHRLDYLEYEGPISGGRGVVSRWDHGIYVLISCTATEFVAGIQGSRLWGRAELRLVSPAEGAPRWRLVYHPNCAG